MTVQAMRILTVLLGIWTLPGLASAVELHFHPETVYADSSEVFTASVVATEVDSLGGFTIQITYDPELLAFVDAEPGALFADYSPPYGLYWSLDEEPGVVEVEAYIIPVDECVAGPGEILDLWFEAIANREETTLHIADASVRDCEGLPIEPLATYDAHVIVGPEAELFFDPDPKFIYGAGHAGSVSLNVDDVPFLRGFQVRLSYDPTVVVFDSALVGGLLDDPQFALWWLVEEEGEALIRIEGVILGPGLYVNGPGTLADLFFTGLLDEGETPLVFEERHVWDVETTEFYPVVADTGLIILDGSLADAGDPRGGIDGSAPGDDGGGGHGAGTGPGTGSGSGSGSDTDPASDFDLPHGIICEGADLREIRLLDPNPGNDFRLSFQALADGEPIRAWVCDVNGRLITGLEPAPAGLVHWVLRWPARDRKQQPVSAGVYFLRIAHGSSRAACRVVVAD